MSERDISDITNSSTAAESTSHVGETVYLPPRIEDLPSRWLRLGAALVDGVILTAAIIPCAVVVVFASLAFGIEQESSAYHWLIFVIPVIMANLIFAIIHGIPLVINGQTWGKKLFGIKMVRTDGSPANLFRLIGLRYFPLTVICVIPYVGYPLCLIDALFIFTKQKRCLHDYVAGTIVVNDK